MNSSRKSFNQDWEYIHSNQEWGIYPAEQVIRFIARNYYKLDRDKIKILDFGCGAGAHTWYLAREGFDVYAFDGSESAVKRAESRLKLEHLSAHFSVSDALDINYPENFFDAVVDSVCIYSNLLEHIQMMYKNVYHILKPGGKLFTSCFGKKTDGFGLGEALEKDTYVRITEGALKGRGTTHFFDQGELDKTLHECGFRNIQVDSNCYTDCGTRVELFTAIAVK